MISPLGGGTAGPLISNAGGRSFEDLVRTNGSGSRPSRAAGAAESAAGTSYCHQDQVAARPCRAARGCSARRSRRWRGGRSRWSRSAEVRPATVLSWPARMYSASATCWMIAAGEGQGSSTASSARPAFSRLRPAIRRGSTAGGRCLPSGVHSTPRAFVLICGVDVCCFPSATSRGLASPAPVSSRLSAAHPFGPSDAAMPLEGPNGCCRYR